MSFDVDNYAKYVMITQTGLDLNKNTSYLKINKVFSHALLGILCGVAQYYNNSTHYSGFIVDIFCVLYK